jgi:PAS domain S-box-containing protein
LSHSEPLFGAFDERQAGPLRQLTWDANQALRACGDERLLAELEDQLRALGQAMHIGGVALLLRSPEGHWSAAAEYQRLGADLYWPGDSQWSRLLAGLAGWHTEQLAAPFSGVLLPYRDHHGVQAWLLCSELPAVFLQEARQFLAAVAQPLLARLAEQRQHQQSERLEVLQRLLGSGWWEFYPASGQLQLAPGLAETLGVGQQLALAEWAELFHPADRAELLNMLGEPAARDAQSSVRLRHSPNWFRLQAQTIGPRVIGFMLDISDIHNQQQQAAAAHARLDNLIASSPAVIYVQRYAEGALLPSFFSASLGPLLGWTLEECQGAELAGLVHPDDRAEYFQRTRRLLREGVVRSRYRLRDKRGAYHWLLDEARLLRDDLGLPVEAVGLWLDDTEATLAAEQVKQSEERYRILVEDSPAMICRYLPDLTLTFGNRPLAAYLECEPEALAGMNLGDWLSAEQRDAFIARLAALTPEQPVSSAEICLQLPGRENAWWVWSDRAVFDEAGRLQEVQAVGRDNTEVRRTQQQLTQSAKMATLGEMATGLAHEINQPLNVMRMAIVNVLKRLSNDDAPVDYLQEKLNRIDAQVQRAARVVDHMRVFGRRSEVEQQLFDPRQALEGTLSLLAEGMKGKGVELRVGEVPFALQVRGHVDQLEQVLINLMVNARDALLAKREGNRDLRPWIALDAERDERAVRLIVQDNGGGIDPRLLEKIFEPFFTTKPVGVGTGLGLSVSYGIVENMGGRLSVSNGDEGARFCVELPIALDH